MDKIGLKRFFYFQFVSKDNVKDVFRLTLYKSKPNKLLIFNGVIKIKRLGRVYPRVRIRSLSSGRIKKYTVKYLYLSWLLKVLVFTMSHIFEIFSFVDACPFNFHGCTDFLHDFRVPAWSCFLDTLKTHQKIYRDTSVYWLFLTGLDDGKGGCVFLSFSMFGYAFHNRTIL